MTSLANAEKKRSSQIVVNNINPQNLNAINDYNHIELSAEQDKLVNLLNNNGLSLEMKDSGKRNVNGFNSFKLKNPLQFSKPSSKEKLSKLTLDIVSNNSLPKKVQRNDSFKDTSNRIKLKNMNLEEQYVVNNNGVPEKSAMKMLKKIEPFLMKKFG